MSETLGRVQVLATRGEVRVSLHGHEQLAADKISVRDAVLGLAGAAVIEDYREYPNGPCVLVLQRDEDGRPIRMVWAIPAGEEALAVLVSGYRPDPERWDETWTRMRK